MGMRQQAIEAAAQAIRKDAWETDEFEPLNAYDDAEELSRIALDAVLAVISEPSAEMVEAASQVWELGSPQTIYQAMLAKLKDKK